MTTECDRQASTSSARHHGADAGRYATARGPQLSRRVPLFLVRGRIWPEAVCQCVSSCRCRGDLVVSKRARSSSPRHSLHLAALSSSSGRRKNHRKRYRCMVTSRGGVKTPRSTSIGVPPRSPPTHALLPRSRYCQGRLTLIQPYCLRTRCPHLDDDFVRSPPAACSWPRESVSGSRFQQQTCDADPNPSRNWQTCRSFASPPSARHRQGKQCRCARY